MSDSSHRVVCLVEYLKPHLRTGRHNGIGTVRAVANNDVLALIFLELHVVLNLSRAVARPQALQRRARLILNRLLALAYRHNLTVHLFRDITHTLFVAAAGTDKNTCVRAMQIRELDSW